MESTDCTGLIVPLYACLLVMQIHMIFLAMLAYSFVNFKNVHVNLNSPVCGERACALSFKDVSYEYLAHFFKMFLGSRKKETIGLRSR